MEIKYQNLAILLLMMAIGGSKAHRVKRLSSPEYYGESTYELAKYVVSIRSRTPQKFFGDNHYCGGGLLSEHWVLTAAHCVMDKVKVMYMPRMLLVVSGTPQRMRFVKGKTICSPVKSLHVPKNFIMQNTMNMALIRLKESLPTENPNIGYLKLPVDPPQIGLNHSILGWGRMYSGGPLSAQIFQLDVNLLDKERCKKHFKHWYPGMLCAGKNNVTIDADPCSGDIGAPVVKDKVVVGIVAYPLGCGSMTLPSVYTDVHHGLKWIRRTAFASSVVLGPDPTSIVLSVVLLYIDL